MAAGLHIIGEEFMTKLFSGNVSQATSVDVGLYNQTTDSLTESDDLAALTTEPVGSAYARQTVSLPAGTSDSATTSNWKSVFATQTFDVSDSSQDVDAYFVVVNFDSAEAGDAGTATDHIMFSGDLSQTYDLNSITTTLDADNLGIQIEND